MSTVTSQSDNHCQISESNINLRRKRRENTNRHHSLIMTITTAGITANDGQHHFE